MKKIHYILATALVALVTLAACSNETLVNESPLPPAKGNSVTFHIAGLTPATRATPAPNASNPTVIQTPALDREKAIADGRLYAVVFGSDGLFRKLLQAVKLAEGSYNFDLAQSGTFYIRLVANPDDALVGKLGTIASASQLDALVASQSPGNNNQATHFLMTSAAKQVTTVAAQSTDAGSIQLERVAARIDLYNRIELLKMTRITFKNRYAQSRLSRGAANLSMAGLAAPAAKSYTAVDGLTDYDCIGTVYGYENMEIGSTVLTLEATYNGNPIGAHDIVVSDLPLKRNHLYSIVISAKGGAVNPGDVFGSLKFDVVVSDWQEGATIEWKGDRLLEGSTPDFMLSGTYRTMRNPNFGGEGNLNPSRDSIRSLKGEVTVTVFSKVIPATLRYAGGAFPAGFDIIAGATSVGEGPKKDGIQYLIQSFTIKIPENNIQYRKLFKFDLENPLVADAKRTFTLAQGGDIGVGLPPLAVVPEYNLAPTTPLSFLATHNFDESNWALFTAEFTYKPYGKVIAGTEYNVLSENTWVTNFGKNVISFTDPIEKNNVYETAQFGRGQYSMATDYKSVGGNIVYAHRFKYSGLDCAYRYEYVPGKHVKVTARWLGANFWGDISDIAKTDFWTENTDRDVVRLFPLWGYSRQQGGAPLEFGTAGYYTLLSYEIAPAGYFGVLSAEGCKVILDNGLTKETDPNSGAQVERATPMYGAVRMIMSW